MKSSSLEYDHRHDHLRYPAVPVQLRLALHRVCPEGEVVVLPAVPQTKEEILHSWLPSSRLSSKKSSSL